MWNVHSCYERLLTGLLGMLSIRWCNYFQWFGLPEISRGKERFLRSGSLVVHPTVSVWCGWKIK